MLMIKTPHVQSAQGFPHPIGCPQAFEQVAGDNSGFIHQVFPCCPAVTFIEPTLVPSQIHMQTPCLPTGTFRQSGGPKVRLPVLPASVRRPLWEFSVVPATNFSPGPTG
jgi:hypothetical protein